MTNFGYPRLLCSKSGRHRGAEYQSLSRDCNSLDRMIPFLLSLALFYLPFFLTKDYFLLFNFSMRKELPRVNSVKCAM